jgi:AcrR family transcriptional regulator
MNKNVDRGQVTRAHLVDVAKCLFGARGYDGTSIEAVLAEAGVSRGSLYHHFRGKDTLFLAVLEDVGVAVSGQIAAAMKDATDPVAALRAVSRVWFRLAADPVLQQILLIDAPTVLGWQRWRDLDEQSSLAVIRPALSYAADAGCIERRHVDMFAHIVLAASNEVALMIGRAEDPAVALSAGESALMEFLDRLLGTPAQGEGNPAEQEQCT